MAGNGARRVRIVAGILTVLVSVGACASGNSRPLVPITPTPTGPTEVVAGITVSQVETAAPAATSGKTYAGSVSVCTGGAESKDFFAFSATRASFDVYCAVLPSSWLLQKGKYYSRSSGDFIDVFYKGSGSSVVEFLQGAQCTTSPADCSFKLADLGPTAFGPMTGDLATHGSAADPDYVVYVNPGTNAGYTLIGTSVSKADLVAFAAAMNKVSKG
jgi:hypothetical protein